MYAIDLETGAERVLHAFADFDGHPSGTLLNVNGTFYGTTNGSQRGTVFSMDAETGATKALYTFCSLSRCPNGQGAFSGVIGVNGMLYGTTSGGGTADHGTAVSLKAKP